MTDPGRPVFLSYASQDADAAQQLCNALRAAGVEVWFDQSELRGGDAWDALIRRQIKGCYLFVPIISANTQSREEGYFRREWNLAVARTLDMAEGRAFLLPIIIDGTPDSQAMVPEKFREVQWTRLPAGANSDAFVEHVCRLLSPDAPTPMATSVRSATLSTSSMGAASTRSHASSVVPMQAALQQPAAASDRPSLAVLPFANLSGDTSQDYFSDGITEEIITAVSRFQGLLVIARNASFTMRGRESDSQHVGVALGAEYLLQGSIRRAGERVRVTAQLVEAATGTQMWAERFDRTLADILDVQDEIAGRIVSAVAPQIRDAEIMRARQPRRTFTRSYDLALRALALCEEAWRTHDRALMQEALDLASESARAQPVSPRAFYAIALTSLRLSDLAYFAAETVKRALEEAQAAAKRFAEMEPGNHLAYILLGYIAMHQYRGEDARRLFRLALDLNPNDPMVARMLSWSESNDGLATDAIAHAHDALLRTPTGRDRPMMLWTLALAHWVGGDPAAALPYAREAIAGTAAFGQRYGVLIACLAELGELDEARQLLARAEELAPGYVKSRLEGKSWFAPPELAARYAAAFRKAAGLE